jgi:hypothetical protein
MSANESRSSSSTSRIRHAPRAWAQLAFRGASVAGLAAALISACASNGGSSAGNNTEGSSQSSTGNNGGNNSGSNNTGTGSGNTGSGSNDTGTGSGNTGSGSNNTGSGTSNTTGSSSTGASGTSGTSSSTGTSGSSSTGGSGSSSATSGGSGSMDAGADGSACTNTDMGTINIDSSGFACNNQWGIEGAWYCYADGVGTSDCGPTGYIPYKASSNAMCMSGTTASNGGYGGGIGLVLSAIGRGIDAGKAAFDAAGKNIVGFAVTVSGTTGGAVLNIGFPPSMESTGESTAVTVPGVSGTPVTYNVMLADAIVSDNTTKVPPPKVSASDITDLQVSIAGADNIAHTYNYCVTKVVPIMAAPAAPGSITSYGPSFNEGKQIVLEGLGAYGLQNDPFGVGSDPMSMTASYGGGAIGFTASPTFGDTGNTPGAFPSIISGWVHGGNYVGTAEGGYAGGKSISALTSVKSSWTYTAGGGKWDAAYDCWLAANPSPISAGFELMVWLGHNTVNPIGGQNTPVTVAGATGSWTVSTGTNGTGQPVVSYLSTTNMTSVTDFDLLPFFKEAASSNRASGLSTSTDLLSVQAGFELYQSGTWTTSSYTIAIQ